MKFKLKLLTWLCLLCLIIMPLQAQEIVTSSGGYGSSASAKVTWTIGEPVTETLTGTNSILTQGFNQGDLIITTVKKPEFPGLSLKAYPNPASDHLKVVAGGIDFENLKYILFDMNGIPLIEKSFTGVETDVPLGNLTPSTYLLKVYQGKIEIAILKIIKK